MFIDSYLDRMIGDKITKANVEERANHKSSGKLSASMLGEPLQWQILKVLGVPPKEIDEYTLRKFKRGKDIEEWFVNHIEPVEKQKFVEYRNTVGFIDATVYTGQWDSPVQELTGLGEGIIPMEVKSTSNAKFKRVVSSVAPDRGHILQACFYAIATQCPKFAISYVATDDLRVQTYVLDTLNYIPEVEAVITAFEEQLKTGQIPVFVPAEKWQENVKYNKYPDWSNLSHEELQAKFKALK